MSSISTLFELLRSIALGTFETLLLAAPFLLFGLLVAGLIHVLLPASLIERWLGRPGMSGVAMAALVGVPLPVCSCGVVPITVEMRRKGASTPACLSFLTTTPESSIDSILFTWGLMGPVMAVARPIAAFFTAVLGGALAILFPSEEPIEEPQESCSDDLCADDGCAGDVCAGDVRAGDVCGGDSCGGLGDDKAAQGLAALAAWWNGMLGRRRGDETPPGVWRKVVRPALRYGFVELLDDLAFWLLLGVLLAGIVGVAVPADLAERGLGSGILPMLLLLVIGIPIYMCASASTPIAAALMAKGVGPGAALVFLLAGPATNVATIVLLSRTFGRRFVQLYLLSVVAGALAAGLALDALVVHLGLGIVLPSGAAGESAFAVVEWVSFAVLVVLLIASLWRGSGRTGLRELKSGFAGLLPRLSSS